MSSEDSKTPYYRPKATTTEHGVGVVGNHLIDVPFYDRATGMMHKVVRVDDDGEMWLCYQFEDGRWITRRRLTADDVRRIENAPVVLPILISLEM